MNRMIVHLGLSYLMLSFATRASGPFSVLSSILALQAKNDRRYP